MKCRKIPSKQLAMLTMASLALGIIASPHPSKTLANPAADYEVWASDQSNSVSNATAPGVKGSWLWIWDKSEIVKQLQGNGYVAKPSQCYANQPLGEACDLLKVFPQNLQEHDENGATGKQLKDLTGFGRLHGMLPDPQNRYMNANIFAPEGGFVGIIDGQTKEAIALFRVSGTSAGRSVHMSFWNGDGSALLVANLNGKILERIDLQRNPQGKIVRATLNKTASLGVGKGLSVNDQPKFYLGSNAQNNPLIGGISGDYNAQALGDLTPNGICKENGCASGSDGTKGGRPNNLIICPITASDNKSYVTFGGGGLLVVDTATTPMRIIGEYEQQVINGAGCGGVQVGNHIWLNAGVSASGAGATQSTFTVYRLNNQTFSNNPKPPNLPPPQVIYKAENNTATLGNTTGSAANNTGQVPGATTRRDSHGMAVTTSGKYVHTNDRIQNLVEVFDAKSLKRTTYDLTSSNGQGQGFGACKSASISGLPDNDPAPDLMEPTPDGKYLMVAFRGPVPVSVNHSAQGSCPGVGIIELTDNGSSGRLVGVLRSRNTVDQSTGGAPGGSSYSGDERSDVHGAAVRRK